MKPILLEMTAFGCYAEKTAVPFDRLAHGLYLITGDTGAGKTTLFDAIVFALYGVASGPERRPDMMHCDFVERSADTVVTLRFEQQGRVYTVTRTIHYPKKRGAAGQYGDGMLDATLWEPGAPPLEGAARVSARCAELLGLNADQFRKIVMLAQGEFKRFLTAGADEKNEILGKLFDNSACLCYQNLLKGARDALEEERAEHTRRIASAMREFFQPPEEASDEELTQYLPEHPELPERLRALAGEETRRLKALQEALGSARERERRLNEQKGAAGGQNQRLEELARQRQKLERLTARREEMERLRASCETAGRALRQVLPAQERLAGAERALEDTAREIGALETELRRQEAAVDAARAAVDADGGAVRELQALEAGLSLLEKALPQYEALEQKQRERQSAGQAVRRAAARLREDGEARRREEEALSALQAEQNGYAGLDAQAVRLEQAYRQAQDQVAALDGPGGIRQRVERLVREQAQLEREQEALRALADEAARLEQRHHALYQALLRGQAGLLAEGLRRELAQAGTAVCPVCHTGFCAEPAGGFAPLPAETPAQEEVDRARRACDRQEALRREQDQKTASLRASAGRGIESVLRDAAALLPGCGDWETLAGPGWLDGQLGRLRQEEAARKSELERLQAKQRRRDELDGLCRQAAGRIAELDEALSRGKDGLAAHRQRAAELDAVLATLQEQLPFPDRESAQRQLRLQKERQAGLRAGIERRRQRLQEAENQRHALSGRLAGKRDALPGLEDARARAEAALRAAMRENGFGSAAELAQALRCFGGEPGEDWLRRQQEALGAYRQEMSGVEARIRELARQTEGLAPVDLAALQREIDQAAEARGQADRACVRLAQRLENHREVLRRVAGARAALQKTEAAWRRLDRLASLAVGVSGEGGKLSFDRYVMGAVFGEILEMANRRLDGMSGGRYELIHQTGAERKNAKAGLEVEVLDRTTGRQRNSRSLSGGESFLASLSLALGLSDVVQNHAGGRRLDALFIDEGFGSLDSGALDAALQVLYQLTEGRCLVGIISHVSRLEECVPQKIRVVSGRRGSTLRLE